MKPWVQFSSNKSFLLGTDCLLGCCACSMKGLFTFVHQMPYHICAHCLHACSFVLTNPKPLCYPLMLFHLLLCLIIPAAAAAKSLQSCPTLCDPMDGSPPGSPVPGILQARTLEWVAISFSNAWKWKVKVKSLSQVWLLATPWTAAYQALPSMGFS